MARVPKLDVRGMPNISLQCGLDVLHSMCGWLLVYKIQNAKNRVLISGRTRDVHVRLDVSLEPASSFFLNIFQTSARNSTNRCDVWTCARTPTQACSSSCRTSSGVERKWSSTIRATSTNWPRASPRATSRRSSSKSISSALSAYNP